MRQGRARVLGVLVLLGVVLAAPAAAATPGVGPPEVGCALADLAPPPVLGSVLGSLAPTQDLDALRHAVTPPCDRTATPTPSPTTVPVLGAPVPEGTPVPAGFDAPVGGLDADLPVSLYRFDGVDAGLVALRGHPGVPFAAPGVFAAGPAARYGSAPRVVSVDGVGGSPRTAGSAVALPSTGPVGGVGLPVLAAVLALAGVTGALVRTWALRGPPG